jgi:AcrR family transcriptional regulator
MTQPIAVGPQPEGSLAPDRRPLSRRVVIAAAIEHVDAHGIASLTMRGLGKRLGVEAMSLYRYVGGREDLLEGVVDGLMDQLDADPGDRLPPGSDWQAYLTWVAHQVRAMALAHPAAFPLVATRHPAAPWLRPPLRSLRLVEQFLDALVRHGFSDEQAAQAYRSFTTFLLGHLLQETATHRRAVTGPEEPLDEGDAPVVDHDGDATMARFPTLKRLQPLLSQDHTDEEFALALEGLLERVGRALGPDADAAPDTSRTAPRP